MQTLLLTLAGLLAPVLAAVAAGHALLNKRDPKSALGWVACCVFLPYAGPLIYLVFGINRARTTARRMRPERDDDGVMMAHHGGPDSIRFPLSAIGKRVAHKDLLPCSDLRPLVNGDDAYPAMLEAIHSAKQRICLATYILANGDISRQFIESLQAAMGRGVEVKVIIDAMGEMMSLPPIGRALSRAGIPYRRFNPFRLVPPSLHVNLRNHRKLLTVDGLVGFTGGMNIADANLHAGARRKAIQDIQFRIEGALAGDLEYSFLRDWQYCCGSREPPQYELPGLEPGTAGATVAWARIVLDGPNEDLDKLSDIMTGVMSAAESRIWVMTPYFLPDAEMIGMFQAARLRGVEVKIILPQDNNIKLSHWATRHMLWQLLKYGVEIHYQEPPFSHAKMLLVDDSYALIGSANLDPRSLRLNYELNVEIFSREVCDALYDYCKTRLQGARLYRLKDRAQRSLPVRLRDALAWLWSPYL